MTGPELIRTLGLEVDGPALWGARIRDDGPGVFVVEWPAPETHAPLDHTALRAWLERVPDLRLDGAAPSPHELGRRLDAFWLAGQTVVYIGMTRHSLRRRLAAIAATRLGDRRPNASGHWLKTLRGLDRARIWWSPTDAAEEYGDALLEAFAASVGRPDAFPFANLEAPSGGRRIHGLTGALLAAEPSDPAPVRSPTPIARRRPTAGPRPAPRGRSGAARPVAKPAAEPTYLSETGRAHLEAELAELRDERRPEIVARVKAARELGDLRENAEYHAAREEHSFLEGRVQHLQALLDAAVTIDPTAGAVTGVVTLGSTVELLEAGAAAPVELTIVGPPEADPRAGRISNRSPLGRALLGRRSGERVAVQTPGGEVTYEVLGVR